MSVQFRQRTPGEYARIIWKRKWLIILPAIAIASAITWVVLRLPDIYESTTLIVVKPSTIPTAVVPASSEDLLTRQLSSIGQFVTSRSSLEPLVVKYRLYEAERMRGEPMESIVDRMHRDIKVELNTTRNEITNGFNITYRGSDPRTTQAVTAELAGKYINAQAEESAKNGRVTKDFFEQQLARVKEELDAIAQKRLDFMTQNLSHLPNSTVSLGTQLTGLFEQQKSYVTDIGRLRDQQNILSQSLGDLQKQRQQEIDNIIEEGNDPKKTPEYLQLSQQADTLEAEIGNMLTTLKPANPDVKKKQQELASVQAKMKSAIEEGKSRAEEKRKRYESQLDPRINTVKYNLENAKGEIVRQQKLLDDTNAQIASVRESINSIPGVQVGLETLDREYATKQETYNTLLKQQTSAVTISDISSSQQGESIQVVDAASLPERPVAPKRPMLIIMGIMLGLFAGFALAAVFEVPRLLTIQTTNDAEHYTGLPVLVAVPELLTPQEARRVPRRRLLLITAGIIATIISIPALAYALKLTHIFDRLVS
ncbi:MAG: protein tyrosine kinase modulator [Acidobacteriota bacterium]|jgi:polysaccharide chain length determinant protein (PEP-CTERM system associated)|nr:protein tyrosine kinase modulator [Acidobacteriota bacterium]